MSPVVLAGAERQTRHLFAYEWDSRDCTLNMRTGQAPSSHAIRNTQGSLFDASGRIATMREHVPRFGYIGTHFGLLCEDTRTNPRTYGSDLTNGVWTPQYATAVKDLTGPDGIASSASRLREDSSPGALPHYYVETSPRTITAGAQQSISAIVKAYTRTNGFLALIGWAGVNDRFGVQFNASLGVATTYQLGTGAVTAAGVRALVDGWYWVWACGRIAAAETDATFMLRLYDNSASPYGAASYQGLGSAYYLGYHGIQHEVDKSYPSSPVLTGAASVTRILESPSWPLAMGLRDFTVMLRVVVPVQSYNSYDNLLGIGNTSNGAELWLANSGANVHAEIRGTPNAYAAGQAYTPGTPVNIVAQYRDWRTGPTCRFDVGGGFGSWSAASDARAALGANLISFNAGSNGPAAALYQAFRLAPSLQDYTTMTAGW